MCEGFKPLMMPTMRSFGSLPPPPRPFWIPENIWKKDCTSKVLRVLKEIVPIQCYEF